MSSIWSGKTHRYEINACEKATLQTIGQVLGCDIDQCWEDFTFDYDIFSSCCMKKLHATNTSVYRALSRHGIVSSIIRRLFGIGRSNEEKRKVGKEYQLQEGIREHLELP